MTVQTNQPKDPDASDDNQSTQDYSQGTLAKEKEPKSGSKQESEILSEIIKSSEAADKQAERALQVEIAEARLSQPEPELPPDISDSGVKVIQTEADNVVIDGSSLNLPISEEEYHRGLHQKVASAVVDKVVVGASSMLGLALWVGRMMKIAHKHAVKVVFRR